MLLRVSIPTQLGATLEWSSINLPMLLLVIVGVGAVVYIYTAGLRGRGQKTGTRLGLLALRLGAIACLLLALLHPTLVSEGQRTVKPALGVVLDNSRSMSAPADPGGPGKGTRYQVAVDVLEHKLLPALAATHEVTVFDVLGNPLEAGQYPAEPSTSSSPLMGTLLRVQRQLRDRGLSGIVLLSDGNDTSQREAEDHGADLDQVRVPVHAVEVARVGAAGELPARVWVQSVSAPARALVHNSVRVELDIGAQGPATGRSVPVAILLGNRPVAVKMVRLSDTEPVTRARIELTPDAPGRFTYLVQVGAPAGRGAMETAGATFPLNVRARPLTVLYIDGVLRPEGKFVREALTSDPDLNVVTDIRTAPPGAGRGSPGLLLQEQLANIDVVILGDVEAGYFSAKEIESLRSWVTQRGGGLLLTGGYLSFGPRGLVRTDLRELLPVEFSAQPNPQIERPFSLKLTVAGEQSPIFHLRGDQTADTRFYQGLPRLEGCCRVAGVKPGAQVLAVDPMVDAGRGVADVPVMVVQQVGSGRSMVFGVDTTWRWRMIVGGFTGDASFYQQFWGQIVRWLAASDDDSAGAHLSLNTDRVRYRPGQKIELRARIDAPPSAGQAEQAWRLAGWAMSESGGQAVPLALSRVQGNEYRATIPADATGRINLSVLAEPVATGGASTGGTAKAQAMAQSQVATVEVEPGEVEMADSSAQPQWLARVTQLSGGQILQPAQVASWAAGLADPPAIVHEYRARELWHHPALIGMFLGLLCVEWIGRRVRRLA